MRRAFGKAIVRLAEHDDRIVLLTGDVVQNMEEFINRWPNRFFNLGLCEQTITSMAAGMAIEGLRPVIYSLTPFLLERPFEQIKVDIDEQNLPVMLIGNSDYPRHGPTHRPLDPRGLVRLLKNTMGFFPHTAEETEKAMFDAYLIGCPAIISIRNLTSPPL